MVGIWHTVDSVLDYPNVIGETMQVIEFQRWIAIHDIPR